MVDIAINHFVRFCGAASPSARLGAVTEAKQGYNPSHDYYRGLRQAIVRGHAAKDLETQLETAVRDAHPKRRKTYAERAAAYGEFAQSAEVEYLRPGRVSYWTSGRLKVRVNPEFVAMVDDQETLTKVWLAKPPSALGLRVLLHLMAELAPRSNVGALVVASRRLFRPGSQPIPHASAFLGSEADAFLSAWKRLP